MAVRTSLREIFHEVFVKFSMFASFLQVFGLAWTCSDVFGCIRMRLDAIQTRLDMSGKITKFCNFFGKINPFWMFGVVFHSRGLTFTCFSRLGGLTFIGAYYWETCVEVLRRQRSSTFVDVRRRTSRYVNLRRGKSKDVDVLPP